RPAAQEAAARKLAIIADWHRAHARALQHACGSRRTCRTPGQAGSGLLRNLKVPDQLGVPIRALLPCRSLTIAPELGQNAEGCRGGSRTARRGVFTAAPAARGER